jgi:hypothetical protein
MWIFRNDAMLSIVEDWDNPEMLLVRARNAGDITNVFPNAEEIQMKRSDYAFRAWIPRDEVAAVMYESVMQINYPNFKDSINRSDMSRLRAYHNVWRDMLEYQERDNTNASIYGVHV